MTRSTMPGPAENFAILYSVAMPLNRGGMGTIGWHAARGLARAGRLARVISTEVGAAAELAPRARGLPWPLRKGMAILNRLRWHRAHDVAYDLWAARQLEPGMGFYGWMNQSLACLRKCAAWGGRTAADRGSVEPRLQQRWLEEEYARFGIRASPMNPATVQRMVREAEECSFVAVPSRLVERSYLDTGHPAERIFVNPLGVDLECYAPATAPGSNQKLRFLFAGQLSIQKGIPDLLDAWKRLNPAQAELVLAGVIPPTEEAVILPRLRGTPNVTWNGHCPDLPSLLRTGDVLVLPSAQDGFGLVVLEAMATGLPVIVSDRVGAADCVREGVTGLVFPFGDANALAERIGWFLADRGRAHAMSSEALTTARQHAWEKYERRLASLYDSP